jgi:hypothetical protein
MTLPFANENLGSFSCNVYARTKQWQSGVKGPTIPSFRCLFKRDEQLEHKVSFYFILHSRFFLKCEWNVELPLLDKRFELKKMCMILQIYFLTILSFIKS